MRQTIVGLFKSMEQCEIALKEIKENGLVNEQISLISKNKHGMHQDVESEHLLNQLQSSNGDFVPSQYIEVIDIGQISVGGPLSVALQQGDRNLAESLHHYGVAEDRAKYLQDKVAEGYILTVLGTDNSKVNQTANILSSYGAHRVEKWNENLDHPLIPHN